MYFGRKVMETAPVEGVVVMDECYAAAAADAAVVHRAATAKAGSGPARGVFVLFAGAAKFVLARPRQRAQDGRPKRTHIWRLHTMGADATLLLLDKNAVEQLLTPTEVTQAVREAFVLHGRREGRVFPVVREKLPTGGVFGIKSGDVPSQGLLGFKAAGFWPRNRDAGGEPHQATILLFDPATGRPLCVIDGNAITTVRTGAAGGLGLELLARKDSTCLTVFGTGVQARSQLRFALRTLPKLSRVRYVSAQRTADPAFESVFAPQCDIRCAPDANQAVSESDVVITATPGGGALL